MLCTHLCTSMCFVAISWSQIPPILDWHWANHMTALVPVKIPPTNRIKLIVSHEPMENIYHNCNQIIRTQPWKYFMPYMWGFFSVIAAIFFYYYCYLPQGLQQTQTNHICIPVNTPGCLQLLANNIMGLIVPINETETDYRPLPLYVYRKSNQSHTNHVIITYSFDSYLPSHRWFTIYW